MSALFHLYQIFRDLAVGVLVADFFVRRFPEETKQFAFTVAYDTLLYYNKSRIFLRKLSEQYLNREKAETVTGKVQEYAIKKDHVFLWGEGTFSDFSICTKVDSLSGMCYRRLVYSRDDVGKVMNSPDDSEFKVSRVPFMKVDVTLPKHTLFTGVYEVVLEEPGVFTYKVARNRLGRDFFLHCLIDQHKLPSKQIYDTLLQMHFEDDSHDYYFGSPGKEAGDILCIQEDGFTIE